MAILRVFLVASMLFLAALAIGCSGDDDASKSADVAIVSIQPEISYQGVNTRVDFEITPGENTATDELSWEVHFGDGQSLSGTDLSSSASHIYERSGQYTVEVFAMLGEREAGSDSTKLKVLGPIDLAISEVRGAPANIQAGGELSVSFSVQNNAAGAVESPFDVQAYLAARPDVSAADVDELIPLGSTTVSATTADQAPIAAGESVSPGFSAQIPEDTGTANYYVVAWANPDGQFSDQEPGNNFAISASAIRVENATSNLPDLALRDIVMTPNRAFPTFNQLSRTFTVTNVGGVDAVDVVAKTWLSVGNKTIDPDSDQLLEESDPFAVAAADERLFELKTFVLDEDIVPPEDGEVEVYLLVEVAIQGDSPEVNLENNTGASQTPTIVSPDRVEGTDIAVSDFVVTPDSTYLDGTLNISMSVKNEGTLDSGSFFCGIYTSEQAAVNTNIDPRLTNINISGLAGGAEQEIDKDIIVPGLLNPGDYYLYVVCDPQGAISDPYRSNNQAIYDTPIQVTDEADVDLYVDELSAPASADAGDTVEIVASICASGSNATGTTLGKLWRSATDSPDYNADAILNFDIPNINPGDCVDVTIETQAECINFEPDYSYAVAVDTEQRLPESDETNNRAQTTRRLSVAGEYCACQADSYDNDDALSAHPVSAGESSRSLCLPERCDFYGVDLNGGESLFVTTSFDASYGDLQTTLFEPNGVNELDSNANEGLQEVATFLAADDGKYVVSVCGATSETQNLYDLEVDIIAPTAGFDVLPRDLNIPVRDTFSIGSEIDISFRIYNLGQQDTPADFDAKIVISPTAVIGDGDDILLTPATVSIPVVPAGSSLDVDATVTIPTSVDNGEYYLGVDLDLADTNPDNNQVASKKITVETLCYDPLEPNDSFGEATPVTSGSYSNLVACNAADDYYEVCVQNGKKFSVRIDFDDAQGDIDLSLFDQEFQEIESSANLDTDFEQVSQDYVNGGQCYYAKVHVLTTEQTLQTQYDMSVAVQNVDPALQCDGAFESNGSLDSASNLLAALQHPTTLDRCPQGDSDYYYVNLAREQLVSFRSILDPGTQAGTLRLQLYNPNGTVGRNQETAPGAPIAEIDNFRAPVAGVYYLQVTISGSQRRASYRMEADGLGALGGVDLAVSDPAIGPGEYAQGDEVRLGFTLTNQGSASADTPSYTIYLGENSVHDSTTDIELRAVSLTQDIAGGDSVAITTRVDLPASGLSDGVAYLHIVANTPSQTDIDPTNNQISTPIPLSIN